MLDDRLICLLVVQARSLEWSLPALRLSILLSDWLVVEAHCPFDVMLLIVLPVSLFEVPSLQLLGLRAVLLPALLSVRLQVRFPARVPISISDFVL